MTDNLPDQKIYIQLFKTPQETLSLQQKQAEAGIVNISYSLIQPVVI